MRTTTSLGGATATAAAPRRLVALGVVASLLMVAAPGAAAPRAAVPPRLGALLAGARAVVAGRVIGVEVFDSGRVAVAGIAVQRTLKGEERTSVRVVEMRNLPSLPPLFSPGEHVLAFLGNAGRTSYLRRTLPEGEYVQPARGRDSVLASSDPAAIGEAAAIVGRLVEASRTPEADPTKRRAAGRALAFYEIAASHPAVVEDGVSALGELGAPSAGPAAQPSADERLHLERALVRADLPVRLRVRLVERIATLGWASLVPALRELGDAGDARLVAAAWRALERLDAAPDAGYLARALGASDPARRAAAARALLRMRGPAEIDRAGGLALSDPAREVRVEVIAALAETGSPAALPTLERAFAEPDWEVRQAVGRAILRIGGRPAAESFARLSFVGPPEGQRYAVTLLRASGVGDDDPLLARIRTEHPDEQVREIVEHGLPFHEH